MMNKRFLLKYNKCYLRLHSSCEIVKGVSRSVICDLSRHTYEFIPNDLYDFIQRGYSSSLYEVIKLYGNTNLKILREYIDFLIEKEYCFLCNENEVDYFPRYSMSFETPFTINNCIVDVNNKSKHDWKLISLQLDEMPCQDLQIRFYSIVRVTELYGIISFFEETTIKNIELIVPYIEKGFTETHLQKLCEKFNRVNQIIVHSSPRLKKISSNNLCSIYFITQVINSDTHCGNIYPEFFSVNRQTYYESIYYNTCLYKKISISCDGEIKNCPSMTKSYGNISNINLVDIVCRSDFKEFWKLNKDQISVCNTCEFRMFCTDCRAFLEDPSDYKSKPLKCGYNPKTMKWENWSTIEEKQKIFEKYKLIENAKVSFF